RFKQRLANVIAVIQNHRVRGAHILGKGFEGESFVGFDPLDSGDISPHHFQRGGAVFLKISSGCRDSRVLKGDADLGQIGELFKTGSDRHHVGRWRHHTAVKSTRGHSRQNLRDATHLQYADLAVSLEPPLFQRQPERKVRGRTEGADADFFPTQIVWFFDSFDGDNGKEGQIDQAGDDHRIDSGQTRRDERAAVNLGEV